MDASDWQELARVHLSNSVTDEIAFLYLATKLRHGAATPEGSEELEVRWLPFEDVLARTLDGRITDAMTVLAIQRVALARLAATAVAAAEAAAEASGQ